MAIDYEAALYEAEERLDKIQEIVMSAAHFGSEVDPEDILNVLDESGLLATERRGIINENEG